MDTNEARGSSLAEVEAEVLAEGREWTRRRLEQRLQELAEQHGGKTKIGDRITIHTKAVTTTE